MQDATRDRIIRALSTGRSITWVCNFNQQTREAVIDVGAAVGLRVDPSRPDYMTARPVGLDPIGPAAPPEPVTANGNTRPPAPAAIPTRLTEPPKRAVTVPTTPVIAAPISIPTSEPGSVDELLEATGKHGDPKTATLRLRVTDAIAALRAHLERVEAEAARRRQAERERAILESRRAALAQQLADLDRQLKDGTAPKSATRAASTSRILHAYQDRLNTLGGRTRVVAWANANGYTIGQLGRIPNAVLDAYETAHPRQEDARAV